MYRTYTYLAGDWDRDSQLIEKLYEWNDSKYWGLSFKNAHDLTKARDSSLNCNIKRSLKTRLDVSKTFVLIVGDHTKSLTAGSCQWCDSYNSWSKYCAREHYIDYRSFIDYECDVAKQDIPKIVVIYNGFSVNRNKCPDVLKYTGKHIPAYYAEYGRKFFNYEQIKNAIMY